jgi:hypothetical protein
MTSRPPSLAFWISPGHICIQVNHHTTADETLVSSVPEQGRTRERRKERNAKTDLGCAPRVVDGAGDEHTAHAVDDQRAVVVRHVRRPRAAREAEQHQRRRGCRKEQRSRAPSRHCRLPEEKERNRTERAVAFGVPAKAKHYTPGFRRWRWSELRIGGGVNGGLRRSRSVGERKKNPLL